MTDIFLGPKRYLQHPGALAEAASLLRPLGRRPMILGDELVFSIVRPTLEPQLASAGLSPAFELFGAECSLAEIGRLADLGRSVRADLVVGTGGGKAIDTARAVAGRLDLPLATMPTSAATCSAASTVSVVYENGIRKETINGKAAELVLVDSAIIAAAPARLLAAGMGDSLAKWYEGKPTFDRTPDPSPSLQAALALSTQIRDSIFQVGLDAKQDADAGRNSPAVEKMIEVNILMAGIIGGIGGRTFRVALAHALLYGLTVLPGVHDFLHGEVVSYGLVVQACMQGNLTEMERLIVFFSRLGLPVTLAELGIRDLADPLFREGLRRTCAPGSSAHNLPLTVDARSLLQAMEAVERYASRMQA